MASLAILSYKINICNIYNTRRICEFMEEETPMPTKDDIYFELLQYCDINPDYDIDDEIRTNMRLYAINELYSYTENYIY